MSKRYLPIVVSALFLTACSSSDEETPEEVSTEPIEVEIMVDQDVELNDQTEIQTKVIQEGEPVEDADDVQIEIWAENEQQEDSEANQEGDEMFNEDSDMVEADHEGDGIYNISYNFEEEGTYEVQSHVTARGMHHMPTETIDVSE